MYRSPPPHPFIILGSVSIFKCDDLSALKHLCMGPLTTLLYPGFSFNIYSSLMTFLHLNISASHPPNLINAKIFHQDRSRHSCVAPIHLGNSMSYQLKTVADLHRQILFAPLPLSPFVFIFMQFSGNFD